MALLFDLFAPLDTLSDRDLRTLSAFGVRGGVGLFSCGAQAGARAAAERARLQRAALSAFLAFTPNPDLLPGGLLEAELQRLPELLSLPGAVALGPVGLGPERGSAETYALERVLELGKNLARPVLVQCRPLADGKTVRRLLGVVRDSGLPAERVLGLAIPRPGLVLFRECGHAVGLALSRHLLGRQLVETVSRFGSERVIVLGNGADFLSLPKAVSLLEEAGVPASVVKRVAFENALKLLGIAALT